MKFGKREAIRSINKHGVCLVYPLKGKDPLPSLWSDFFPRSNMDWAWDEEADERVNDLWILMKELSTSRKVVYSKWFRDRGTFFSQDIFVAYLAYLRQYGQLQHNLFPEARLVFQALSENSPLSTKELKKATELEGAFFKSTYSKALRVLYRRGLIVSYGEQYDGVFPSACMGATSLIFEELWKKSQQNPSVEPIERLIKAHPAFARQVQRVVKELSL